MLPTPVDGDTYLVTGTAAGARVEVLTAGLVESQPVDMAFEIDRDSSLVTRMEFSTTGETGVTHLGSGSVGVRRTGLNRSS